MMLINSLLSNADDNRWEEFIDELERLNVRKAVVVRLSPIWSTFLKLKSLMQRLMSSHTIEDLTSSILDFQANMIRVTYRRKTHFVDPVAEPSHLSALEYIWNASKLEEEEQPDGLYKWRKLGFHSEDPSREFVEVGVLGLDCLVRLPPLASRPWRLIVCFQKNFACKDPDYFATVVTEQISRPPERRCPIARASNEIVELLSEHWAIFAPGCW